jgi:acyl carrier protein
MDANSILGIMKAYFVGKHPPEDLESFGDKMPRSLMKDSFQVVDFIVCLEEKTGCHIDIAQVGQEMMDKTFAQIAAALAARLSQSAG